MSTQRRTNEQESNNGLGQRAGRGTEGYSLLLERMSVEQWDAFRDGEIDADTLREQLLGDDYEENDDEQTDLAGWA
jgi:hypothetical protein